MKRFSIALGFVLLFGSVWLHAQVPSQMPVPPLVNFSGVLADGNGKPTTNLTGVTFLLYQAEQGGAPLWLETQNVQPDSTGHYSVMLGSTTSTGLPSSLFVAGEARWLGVQPQGQPEQPRVMLLSVPYAMKAGDAQTVGGLPPTAFVLAASPYGSGGTNNSLANPASPNGPVVGGSGTTDYIPIWTDSTGDLGNSAIFQTGASPTAKVGINTTTPAAALDVKGNEMVRGFLETPAIAIATASVGYNSNPMVLVASSFNSSTAKAVTQNFVWQSEPLGNNTTTPSGTLNLLFGAGTASPKETGLHIASNGQITFATGQAFPGTGSGTVTSVGSALGLTGGPITASGTLAIDTTVVPQLSVANVFTANQTINANLAANQLISTAVQGTAPLQVTSTTQVPNLNASYLGGLSSGAFQPAGSYASLGANIFAGTQTISSGNLALSNTTDATSGVLMVGSSSFLHNYPASSENTFVGSSAGNFSVTGTLNTGVGYVALQGDSTGGSNTAVGNQALTANTTGSANTAVGTAALPNSADGGFNTAVGFDALVNNTHGLNNSGFGISTLQYNTTGSFNTALGSSAGPDKNSTNLTNATAIGANAVVSASNALVLGCTSGLNYCPGAVSVGIGTPTPAYTLDVQGNGRFTQPIVFASNQTFPGSGTITGVTAGTDLLGGGTTGIVTLSVDTSKVVTGVTAGTDLTGGGAGGVPTLNLDTTKVPQLATANTFTGNQTVNGNLSATGAVTGSSFQIGSNLFDYGSYTNANAFLGFSGNTTTTGGFNTASGFQALYSNTTADDNTASGGYALFRNSTGDGNTAIGTQALFSNTVGSFNTASGTYALQGNTTGSYNTALGFEAGPSYSTLNLTNTTALGAYTQVTQSNTLVLGCNTAVNVNCPGNVSVGIGTATPDNLLTVNGSADKPGGGSWGTYSDRRLKTLDGDFSSGLSRILKINPVRYRYKPDNAMDIHDSEEHVGVVAQEVRKLIPEAVTENSKGYLLVNNDPIIWTMLNAIKEQQREIKQQQSLLRAQAAAMRSLKAEVRETREALRKVKSQIAAAQPALVAAK